MPLPEDHLRYPKRGYGQDIARYEWALAKDRPPKTLAGGEALAVSIVVPLEFFMLNPSGKPYRHPGAMQTPYPDLRHFTTRDYGTRVGAFRLLEAFAAAGVRATFAVNAAILDRAPPLIEAIVEAGHEIAAHGLDTDAIHWGGLDPDTEKRYVAETREAFARWTLAPRVWMSPARQQSAATPDLIRASGFDICLDWEIDTVPIAMQTAAGPLSAFPLVNELDDRLILATKNHSEDSWRDQLLEAAAMMRAEASTRGAQVFAFTMTPYIAGLPFRMRAVREMLAGLAGDASTLVAPVSEIDRLFA